MGLRRRTTFPLTLASFTAAAASGCAVRVRQGSASPTATGPEREAPRIDVDAALAEVRAGRAVLVDVRSAESFNQRRPAGAVLLTLDDIERAPKDAVARLPAEKRPIFYCT